MPPTLTTPDTNLQCQCPVCSTDTTATFHSALIYVPLHVTSKFTFINRVNNAHLFYMCTEAQILSPSGSALKSHNWLTKLLIYTTVFLSQKPQNSS